MKKPTFKHWIVSVPSYRSRRDAPNARIVRTESQSGRDDDANSGTPSSGLLIVAHHAMAECCQKGLLIRRGGWIQQVLVTSKSWKRRM